VGKDGDRRLLAALMRWREARYFGEMVDKRTSFFLSDDMHGPLYVFRML
jgi:hypothetical protein